jgi:hypothetical protein
MNGTNIVTQAPGRYIHWGVLQISSTNATIISVMIVLFILALVVPFPSGHGRQGEDQGRSR